MKITCISFFVLLFIYQPVRGAAISGTVIDQESGQPVEFAHVYLANTRIGTTTDQHGRFILDNVPSGEFDLIITMVGYKPEKMHIYPDPDSELKLNIKLQPDDVILNDVEVNAKADRKWQRQFEKFKRQLLGNVLFADDCTFENPWVVNFNNLSGSNHYSVSANQPLTIINNALGFRISYLLQTFEVNKGQLVYSGYPIFSDTEDSNSKEVEINREFAFYGSDRHFFFSLINDRIEEEGFEVYLSKIEGLYYEYDEVQQKLRRGDLVELKREDFEVRNTSDGNFSVWLNGTVDIFYSRDEKSDFAGGDFRTILRSRLKMTRPVKVASHGYVFTPLSFICFGYFAEVRLAYMLPFEYGLDQE